MEKRNSKRLVEISAGDCNHNFSYSSYLCPDCYVF